MTIASTRSNFPLRSKLSGVAGVSFQEGVWSQLKRIEIQPPGLEGSSSFMTDLSTFASDGFAKTGRRHSAN